MVEISSQNEEFLVELARGDSSISGLLATINPETFANGFYTLRMTACDITGRSIYIEKQIEISTLNKATSFQTSETDFVVENDSVSLNVTRVYDSLNQTISTGFGKGWRWAERDFMIETSSETINQKSLGIYQPLTYGTRLYLTTPEGDRIGFTFVPKSIDAGNNLVYYTPAWVSDLGTYQLESVDAILTQVGTKYYELATGLPYNPASGYFDGTAYVLTDIEGRQFELDGTGKTTGIRQPDGKYLLFTENAVLCDGNVLIQFV